MRYDGHVAVAHAIGWTSAATYRDAWTRRLPHSAAWEAACGDVQDDVMSWRFDGFEAVVLWTEACRHAVHATDPLVYLHLSPDDTDEWAWQTSHSELAPAAGTLAVPDGTLVAFAPLDPRPLAEPVASLAIPPGTYEICLHRNGYRVSFVTLAEQAFAARLRTGTGGDG